MAFDETKDAAKRTRLANERTYLAWWRTGLTSIAVCIGLGLVVAIYRRRLPIDVDELRELQG